MSGYDNFIDIRNSLVKKKLVPHHTLSYLLDPNSVRTAWNEYNQDLIKEFVCPHCGIVIKAARTWFRQHLKMHSEKSRYQEKTKSDENHDSNAKVYFQ